MDYAVTVTPSPLVASCMEPCSTPLWKTCALTLTDIVTITRLAIHHCCLCVPTALVEMCNVQASSSIFSTAWPSSRRRGQFAVCWQKTTGKRSRVSISAANRLKGRRMLACFKRMSACFDELHAAPLQLLLNFANYFE